MSDSTPSISALQSVQRVVIVTHTTELFGPPHALLEYLKVAGKTVIFIAHPLTFKKGRQSTVEVWQGNCSSYKAAFPNILNWSLFNYTRDFVATLWFLAIIRFKGYLPSTDLFLGYDSLSCLPGIWFGWLFGIRRLIAYNADYSETRFQSALLNRIYTWADRYTTQKADTVWCVTGRIAALRRKQGRKAKDVQVVSNGVSVAKIGHTGKHDNGFVYIGNLEHEKGVDKLIAAIAQSPTQQLTVYGDGPELPNLRKLAESLGLKERVHFAGKKSNATLLQELSNYRVGIALYNQLEAYVQYCDSLKVKEYLAAGLPVIMTDVPEIAERVKAERAGVVIHDLTELPAALERVEKEYNTLSKQAQQLGRDYDWPKIFDTAFRELAGNER